MLSKEQINRLDALAAKATPGPWFKNHRGAIGPRSTEEDQSYGMVIPVAFADVIDSDGSEIRNAEFIAAANPQAVSELIAMLRQSQKDLEGANAIKAMIMGERAQWESAARSIVEALGEDAPGLCSPDAISKLWPVSAVALRGIARSATESQKDAARYRYVQDVADDLCVCQWCEEDSSWHPFWVETPDKSIDEHMQRDCDGAQHAKQDDK